MNERYQIRNHGYSFYGVTDIMEAPHNSKNPCILCACHNSFKL